MRIGGVETVEQDSRKIMAALRAAGFELVSVRGSHHKFRNGDRTVIVPHLKKDLPLGTARAIHQQAGLLE